MSATPLAKEATAGQSIPATPAPTPRGLPDWLPWLISLVVLLVGLELGTRFFAVPRYIIPPPTAVFDALVRGFSTPLTARDGYYLHLGTTLLEALFGFTIGSVFGIGVGAIVNHVPVVKRILVPYLIAIQSLPKIAIAPLFVVWFGFGITSKIVMGVLLTFFPLLINTMAGLDGVEPERLELMKSLKAGAWKTFRLVKFPSALPFIFAGLEMGAAYSVLGAVVGEFVGGQSGMGVLILNMNASMDIAGTFSALVVLGAMGLAIGRSLGAVRRRVLFWAPSAEDAMSRR